MSLIFILFFRMFLGFFKAPASCAVAKNGKACKGSVKKMRHFSCNVFYINSNSLLHI